MHNRKLVPRVGNLDASETARFDSPTGLDAGSRAADSNALSEEGEQRMTRLPEAITRGLENGGAGFKGIIVSNCILLIYSSVVYVIFSATNIVAPFTHTH